MEKVENELKEIWNKISSKIEIKIKDIDEINQTFSSVFNKIQRQRERLESSRDMWKSKYNNLIK